MTKWSLLQNELKSCSFGDNTLLDVLREAARKCSVDNYAEPSPAQVMSAISDVVESPELVEKAYWWLCVYGVFRFKDIDRWWSSGQNPVWTKSVGFVMLANRGRYLPRQLASENLMPDPTQRRRSTFREHDAWCLASSPVALDAFLRLTAAGPGARASGGPRLLWHTPSPLTTPRRPVDSGLRVSKVSSCAVAASGLWPACVSSAMNAASTAGGHGGRRRRRRWRRRGRAGQQAVGVTQQQILHGARRSGSREGDVELRERAFGYKPSSSVR